MTTADYDATTYSKKHVSKPDADAHSAQMADLTKQIDAIKLKQTQIKDKLSNSGEKGKGGEERKALKEKIDAIKVDSDAHQVTRKQLFDKIDAIKEARKKKNADIKSSKDKLAYKSTGEIDRRLNEIESLVESGTLKIVEEKRLLSDMTSLRKQRKVIEAFGGAEGSIEADTKKIEILHAQITDMEPKGKGFKKDLDTLYTQLKAIDADRNQDYAKQKTLYNERDELNKQIQVLFDEKRTLHADFKANQDAYYTHIREENARRDAQRKKEQEEWDQKKKMESVQRARELAELPAFEAEISSCSALIYYLNTLTGNNFSVVTATTAAETPATKGRQVSQDNLPKGVALKKKSDQDDMLFMQLGKKKTQPSKKKEPVPAAMKFDLQVMSQFLSLKVDIPSKMADVPKAIEALQAKKQHFVDNQERVTKENVAKAKALEEKVMASVSSHADASENGVTA